jgi:hypothetical protein
MSNLLWLLPARFGYWPYLERESKSHFPILNLGGDKGNLEGREFILLFVRFNSWLRLAYLCHQHTDKGDPTASQFLQFPCKISGP